VQYKLKELNEKIRILHKNIELLLASLKNKAVEVIKDEASVRWIDPVLCSLNMNKKEAQNIILKQDSVQLNQLASSQQFNLRSETQVAWF
jgi:hypothetical protein